MMKKMIALIALAAFVAPAGLVTAHYQNIGNPNCEPEDEFHVYLKAGGVAVKTSVLERRTGLVTAGDGNLQDCPASTGRPGAGDGIPFDFDGDIEYGVGGAAHPTLSALYGDRSAACGWHSSHHDSTFTVADHNFATVAFAVGSDATQVDEDPTTPAIDGCSTDNVISQTLDPNDCQADLAVTPPQPGLPSTGTCAGGWDGLTWVFVLQGLVEVNGVPVLSTPTDGDTF